MPVPTPAEARARMAAHLAAAERELAAAFALVTATGAAHHVKLTDHHICTARTAVQTAQVVSACPDTSADR